MEVRPAESERELDEVRRLFRAFVAWHRERHSEDRALIDAYFGEAAYEREIQGLPGAYAPPEGALLACWDSDLAVGCVAFKRLHEHACEMKRLFVPAMARGRGVGRLLVTDLLERARRAGYREMYLDTSIRQTEAIALYRDLGFQEVEPYTDLPEAMQGWLAFYRLAL